MTLTLSLKPVDQKYLSCLKELIQSLLRPFDSITIEVNISIMLENHLCLAIPIFIILPVQFLGHVYAFFKLHQLPSNRRLEGQIYEEDLSLLLFLASPL